MFPIQLSHFLLYFLISSHLLKQIVVDFINWPNHTQVFHKAVTRTSIRPLVLAQSMEHSKKMPIILCFEKVKYLIEKQVVKGVLEDMVFATVYS